MATTLTDDQIIIMLEMSSSRESEVALAIDAPVEAVSRARWEIKRHGWTCVVRYGACRLCGQPLAIRSHQLIYAFHPDCWCLANQDVIKRREVKQAGDAQRAIEAASGWTTRQAVPKRSHARWTAEDDEVLRSMLDQPIALACATLQRTRSSVLTRRRFLRGATDRD